MLAETEFVSAAAGGTVKLSVKDLTKGSNVTKSWTDFLHAFLRTIIFLMNLALANTSR